MAFYPENPYFVRVRFARVGVEVMLNVCRILGHRAARSGIVRDPFTFVEQSSCKRCGTVLARSGGAYWRPALPNVPPPAHAHPAIPLPTVVEVASEEPRLPPLPFQSREAREAYRRGAHDLYEMTIDRRLAPHRRELSDWFRQLDSWQGGDPPPPPAVWQLQL
jgi:hypothetical protein